MVKLVGKLGYIAADGHATAPEVRTRLEVIGMQDFCGFSSEEHW
jgi:hypothetical protein